MSFSNSVGQVTLVSTATSRQHPTATANSNDSDEGPPGISKSSSLLFGFLITFLALFVAFMACGLGTRRALDFRRRRGGRLDAAVAETTISKPPIWDVWIADGKADWGNMLPLSATLKRPHKPIAPPPPSPVTNQFTPEFVPAFISAGRGIARVTVASYVPTRQSHQRQREQTSPAPQAQEQANLTSGTPATSSALEHLVLEFPWVPFLPRRQRSTEEEARRKQREEDAARVEGLQVSVLIAMPAPHKPSNKAKAKSSEAGIGVHGFDASEYGEGQLGEYVLGVADMPWDKKDVLG